MTAVLSSLVLGRPHPCCVNNHVNCLIHAKIGLLTLTRHKAVIWSYGVLQRFDMSGGRR